MDTTFFNSRIDWWIPVIVIVTASFAFIGPMIDGEIFWVGLLLGVLLAIMEIVMFASVKYQICGDKFGVRNCFYRWEWFPIDKISEVKKTSGILSATALSTRRVSIKFSDCSILKSSMPLEISPKDREGFIAQLKEINPNIKVMQ
ncbi:MAG: PH domain-containing protein [Firmicutes bacterium]|nr:PH domain-containing protein [Bacillota bacterium]MCM1401657.1 PH domain-containing protein [Bacteroides sp.]MCM1477566.1 PH domain-containing protein [Bacteroides sp.]